MAGKTGDINFKVKPEKIVECLLHLAHRVKKRDLDQYRVAKLVYLADVAHLNRYERPITFDRFMAMQNGPVPSLTYDLLRQNASAKRHAEFRRLPFKIGKNGKGHIHITEPRRDVDMTVLSGSDVKILDQIIDAYADMDFDELLNLTHEHPAWKNAWKNRDDGRRAKIMRVEDMIVDSENKKDIIEELRATAPYIV